MATGPRSVSPAALQAWTLMGKRVAVDLEEYRKKSPRYDGAEGEVVVSTGRDVIAYQ